MHSGRDGQREAMLKAMITARDARIDVLEKEVAALKTRLASTGIAPSEGGPLGENPRKVDPRPQRTVEIARVKRRTGEADRKRVPAQPGRQPVSNEAGEPSRASKAMLAGRSFLYVGGRDCQVVHLRRIASAFGANLIHHDGGLREAVSRIDNVLPSVDCVFCPIDCISHDACLRVKSGCKKWEKAFVPLRNGSKSSFEKALQTLSEESPDR
ncbi:uncharacterized protein DUF2325 [Mycoplana dimorpha]|uniref:Uncharacterized protein DUF2325 n=1 Tax=Mycoplana dimorpha TaxID=28320 RepID=A0A2T5B1C3_MYCDI|nr:uncharacterized protein DUF2325 [Mycoplana dimorpha]